MRAEGEATSIDERLIMLREYQTGSIGAIDPVSGKLAIRPIACFQICSNEPIPPIAVLMQTPSARRSIFARSSPLSASAS